MRKIIDDQRLIYRCCSLYYENNMGQKQIAERLGISKSSVSRMLMTGRELGIVEIKVHHLSQYMYEDLEEQLKKKFHLRDVVVAESSPLDSKADRVTKLNERAADYLDRLLQDGNYIGVSIGSTIRNIARAKKECASHKCVFVPLVGGIGRPGTTMQEESVRFIFDYFKKLDIVISGMNVESMRYETVEKLGYVTKETIEEFRKKGAVCNLVLRFFDIDGNTKPFEEYNKKIAGISMEAYRKVPIRILLTAGTGKADSIKGCIHGGYANVLIIDVDCAKELLQDS